MRRVGLIGCGIVGQRLGTRILQAGFTLRIHDRHPEKGQALRAQGAAWVDTPADVGTGCDALVSALPRAEDLKEALLGNGAWSRAAPGTVHVDTSTVGVACARELAGEGRSRGIRYLDSPISAAEADGSGTRLALFVAGHADHYDLARPLLSAMADRVHFLGGPPGTGQVVKLVNNLTTHCLVVALGEALALGLKAGIPIEMLHAALHDGTAQCRLLDELLPPSAFRGDWRPGLRLELALKDLDLAEDLSRETEVEQHLLPTVRSLFEEARRHGWADLSAHAVLRLFEQSARVSYRSAVFEHPPED